MKTSVIISLIYGVMVIVGGVFGYVKAGSKPSLIAGSVFGVAILLSSAGLWYGKTAAVYGLIALAATLLVFFGKRYMDSQAFMPAGLMVLLSIGALITGILKLRGTLE